MESKYVAYLRKSSESDDRQALSLPAQEVEIQTLTKKLGITVVAKFEESKSAKKPGRKEFGEMVQMIKERKAEGILVWHPNRLSRNSVDAGNLIYLMDQGILKSIVTPTRTYTNTPADKFFLSFEWSNAKLENDNKSVDVKRGMIIKANLGWRPGHAPTGYKNTPHKLMGYRTIVPDSRRFSALQTCWYSILQGKRPVEVYEEACSTWTSAGHTDTLISKSGFYRMISSPFYCGEYEWPLKSGNWYKGKHQPMITKEVFDLVQTKVNPHYRPLRGKHSFSYKALFYCGVCGCMVTGTRKFKFNKSKNSTVAYDYYRCSHKSENVVCKQPPINKTELNEQLGKIISSIRVPKEFLVWAKKWSDYLEDFEFEQRKSRVSAINGDEKVLEKRAALLLEKLLDGTVSDADYKIAKRQIDLKLENIQQTKNTQPVKRTYREIMDEIEFARVAKVKFAKADDLNKGRVVRDLGSNFSLTNKKVAIQLKNTYFVLSNQQNWLQKQSDKFELAKYADILSKRPDLVPANPSWLPSRDSNPNIQIQILKSYH